MYNKPYNTRHSGRYNSPGHFVPAGELQQVQPLVNYTPQRRPQPAPPLPSQPPPQMPAEQPQTVQQPTQQQPIPQTAMLTPKNLLTLQSTDVEMKTETPTDDGSESSSSRLPWLKSKLAGIRKVSNRERRRRQNEHLRRLLTPKNALMVLNEMMPKNEQFANQFKVQQAGVNTYYNPQSPHTFCADLTVEGANYKGFGENKMMARNAAAEQAIRDLIIRKMTKALAAEGDSLTKDVDTGDGGAESAPGADEEPLPMIQLASFALHKLFTEWEYDGHKVPTLKPSTPAPAAEGEAAPEAAAAVAARAPKGRKARSPRELPPNASAMHPCMLLTVMRPSQEYRELAVLGDRPQNMLFTMGVLVDGTTYIGKASNKREARKAAARSACEALFGVVFDDVCTATAPAKDPN